jgi:hypothetical protein
MSSSPSSSNLYKTFTIDPSDNLSQATTYKTRVKTGIKDSAGNSLSSQYETSNGFTTETPSFVAVGYNGNLITSLDGISWTSRSLTVPSGGYSLNGVNFVNDAFWIAESGYAGTIKTSKYGISWDNITTGYTDPNTANFNDIAYGNNKYVAAGGPQHNIFTSSDGTSWDNKSLSGNGQLVDLIFGNGVFVAVGTGGHIQTSSDGISWTKTSASSNNFKGVTYGNSIFVAVAGYGVIYTSTNGINWTETLGVNNSVATSPYKSPPSTSDLFGVTYGNSIFVVVGGSGAVLTSTNGTSWTARFSMMTANLGSIQSVTYGNGIFVAVGNATFPKTFVITSTDGITWTERTSGVSIYLWDVTYGE